MANISGPDFITILVSDLNASYSYMTVNRLFDVIGK
jgi:hypothetical protein